MELRGALIGSGATLAVIAGLFGAQLAANANQQPEQPVVVEEPVAVVKTAPPAPVVTPEPAPVVVPEVVAVPEPVVVPEPVAPEPVAEPEPVVVPEPKAPAPVPVPTVQTQGQNAGNGDPNNAAYRGDDGRGN